MGQSDLPLARADRHVRAFERLGWTKQRGRGKGSHIVLTKPGVAWTVCLPTNGDVKRGLLAKQLQGAGITEAAYLMAFRN